MHGWEISDYTIGRALSSPPFTQKREDPASRAQAYHSLEESLLSGQSLSVGHVRTGRPVSDEFGSLISNVRECPRRDSENEQIRILLERQKEQILADCSADIQKHEFQDESDWRSVQKLSGIVAGDEQLRRDQQFLHEQSSEQNRDLREAHEKSLNEMEELKKFQSSTFDTIARRLIEDHDTVLELTGKIRELQNETYCMNDSRDFKDAESVRSGQSHDTSQPAFSLFFQILAECLGMPSRNNGPPSTWDTHGISGNVLQTQRRLLQHLIRKGSTHGVREYQNRFTHQRRRRMRIEHQFQIRDASRGPSARNSVVPSEGGFSKNFGADQQRL